MIGTCRIEILFWFLREWRLFQLNLGLLRISDIFRLLAAPFSPIRNSVTRSI